MRRVIVLGLGALLMAGCAVEPPAGPRQIAVSPGQNSIFVSRGETVYDIARRYRVPLRDLIEANRLNPPYAVEAGQRLVLPTPSDYAVQPGDTLYGIARQFQVDMSEVVRLNGIQPPYVLRSGQTVRLPGRSPVPPVTTVAQAPQRSSPPASRTLEPTPPPTRAARPTVETAELPPVAQAAPVPPPAQAPATTTQSRPGPVVGRPTPVTPAPQAGAAPSQQGRRSVEAEPLPPVAQAPATAPPQPSAPSSPAIPAPSTPAVAPASRTTAPATAPATPVEAPRQQTAALPAVPEAPPARSGKRFAWPVQGEILSDYGPKSDGLRNDGINISAAAGTPVRAADNGIVAYAGNQLRAFGNLVLIRHADGFVTVYGHLDQTKVEQGTKVNRGQTIGTVGQTGNVRVPQLHFGIRKGEQPLDPKTQLDR